MVIHTYPSKRSLQAVKAKVRQITHHTGPDQAPDQLLHRVNRVLRGWCNYFRHGVSSATFAYLRHYAYWRVVGWLRRKTPQTELALAAPHLPHGAVAIPQRCRTVQPGGSAHRALPLPGRADPDTLGARRDRVRRPEAWAITLVAAHSVRRRAARRAPAHAIVSRPGGQRNAALATPKPSPERPRRRALIPDHRRTAEDRFGGLGGHMAVAVGERG
jgi:hypothetical protein